MDKKIFEIPNDSVLGCKLTKDGYKPTPQSKRIYRHYNRVIHKCIKFSSRIKHIPNDKLKVRRTGYSILKSNDNIFEYSFDTKSPHNILYALFGR